jgi:anhydro-N-acetylmuramic acid kinase
MAGQRLAIGLMSGTSMDGVDVAAIETDGRTVSQFGPTLFRPYSESERAAIRVAVSEAPAIGHRADRPAEFVLAERVVTEAHIDALKTFFATYGLSALDVAVIGFHGQTVFHAPARGITVQLGDGLALARAIGATVVYDFRAADVAAGGEGAPLVPIYHAGLVAKSDLPRPVAVLNIGGVANLTFVGDGGDGDLLAFDCGPGNALIDDWCLKKTGAPVDEDGRAAAKGRVDEGVLADLMAHPFFAAPAPKSLDRNAFSSAAVDRLSLADGAATLTAFTAEAVAAGLRLLPAAPKTLIVAGGGAHNPTLMRMIAARTDVPVTTASGVGWSTDFLEAQAFAHLAVRHLEGLPLSFPGTTGVAEPTCGGVTARA